MSQALRRVLPFLLLPGASCHVPAPHEDPHLHPEAVLLGEERAGLMAVRAFREPGPLEPGEDVPLLLWLGFNAADPTPVSLGAWLGTPAERERRVPAERLALASWRHQYHLHVRAPDAPASDTRVQVEILDTAGVTRVVSFPLDP